MNGTVMRERLLTRLFTITQEHKGKILMIEMSEDAWKELNEDCGDVDGSTYFVEDFGGVPVERSPALEGKEVRFIGINDSVLRLKYGLV